MRPRFITFVQAALAICSAAASVTSAVAQTAAPAVTDQLRTQYKIVKLGLDSNGPAVVDPGTVLTIQKGGLLGIPPTNPVECAAKYQDGELHAAGGFCAAMVKNVSRFFQKGEKVYLSKIDVNVKKEQISFKVIACDACNGTNPPSFFKSEVVFQFAKGYLETAQAAQVQDAIAQVFSNDAGDAQQAQGAQPPGNPTGNAGVGTPSATNDPPAAAPAADSPPAPIAPPPPPADQPPVTIEIGQTVDQVVAALGQPQKIVKLGAKQIYIFKDLKVTFNDGKVSDVQ